MAPSSAGETQPIGALHAAGRILLLLPLELMPLLAALCMRGRYQLAAWRACSNRYTEYHRGVRALDGDSVRVWPRECP